ncbi:MAG: hypothetical protein H8E45_04325 [Proteobacteria bacterium]|nr:hypothetical protein [Pseudomonadota bacterium]
MQFSLSLYMPGTPITGVLAATTASHEQAVAWICLASGTGGLQPIT